MVIISIVFWFLIILIIISLGCFIFVVLALCSDKNKAEVDAGCLTVIAGFVIVITIPVYFLSGPIGYKPTIKKTYRNIVHFYKQEVKLEKKIAELSELRKALTSKKVEVTNLQREYNKSIQKLVKEIKKEKRKSGIRSFTQAKKHPRISYDLSLIQRKTAYIVKLHAVELKLKNGTYELEFLERQAKDDLRIVQTLGTEEVDELMSDINQVIEKYLPEAGDLAIDVDPNSMQTPEEIWREIN